MKKNLLFLALIGLVGLMGCSDPDVVGVDVQPGTDHLNVLSTDTFRISTVTQKDDSVISKNATYNLLGSYKDPVFGQVDASIYTQLRLFSSQNALTGVTVDSAYLSLPYASVAAFGDTTVAQTVNIYKVSTVIPSDTAFYSSRSFTYDNTAIGTATFIPHFKDSLSIAGVKKAPQIRIRLDNAYAAYLMQAANTVDDNGFVSVTSTNPVYGLYIKSTQNTGNGNIAYLNLLSTESRIYIYYKDNTNSNKVFSDIGINGNAVRIGHFDHDYAGTAIKFNQKDTTASYLQTMSGTRVKLTVPGLKAAALANKILINQAELIIPVIQPIDETTYKAPDRIIVVAANSADHYVLTADNYEGLSYFGGYYNSSKKEYHFNISKYVQSLINNFKNNPNFVDYGLYLSTSAFIANSTNTANRVVLAGGGKTNRIKLKLTYTKLK